MCKSACGHVHIAVNNNIMLLFNAYSAVEVVQAFPCRCDLTNEEQGSEMEKEVCC